MLDLTDAAVRSRLAVAVEDLTADDLELPQRLADAARAASLDGVLAPSAALPGQRTLAVFPVAVDRGAVTVETERVQVPPIDLVRLLPHVRAVPAAAAAFQTYTAELLRRPYEALRRRYRR